MRVGAYQYLSYKNTPEPHAPPPPGSHQGKARDLSAAREGVLWDARQKNVACFPMFTLTEKPLQSELEVMSAIRPLGSWGPKKDS